MKIIIKYFLIISLVSFSGYCFSVSTSNPTDRIKLELDNKGQLKISNEYMTNYILRVKTPEGKGNQLYIKRNKTKVNFDVIDTEVPLTYENTTKDGEVAIINGFYLSVKGKLPKFNSVKTTAQLPTEFAPINGDWKNATLEMTGGSLADYLEHKYDYYINETVGAYNNRDEDIAFLLNLLSLTEHSLSIIDKSALGGKATERIKKIQAKISKLTSFSEAIATYYPLAKVIVEVIADNAVALGGVDAEGNPIDKNLANYYRKFKNFVEIADRISKVLDLNLKEVDPELSKTLSRVEKLKKDITFDFETTSSDVTNKTGEEISKYVSSKYKANRYDAISKFIVQPTKKIISAYRQLLLNKYKGAIKNNEKEKAEKLKNKITILTAGRGILNLYTLFFDSKDLLTLIKKDPLKAPEIIVPMLWDISLAISTMYLSEDEFVSKATAIYEKTFSLFGKTANVAKDSAGKAVYYKAFVLGREAANSFIPFMYDFVLAPNRINTSIVNGHLNQFGPMKFVSEIVVNKTRTSYMQETSPKDFYIYAKEGEPVDITCLLHVRSTGFINNNF
jgi:hypothetical protein